VELLERETAALLAFVRAALERVPTNTDTDADATDADTDATPTATKTATGTGTGTGTGTAAAAAGAGDALASYADPAQAAEMFAQMMRTAQNGLAAWWYEHREVPREAIVQRLLDFCWLGLERVATGDR
jgi:hypothetical protein